MSDGNEFKPDSSGNDDNPFSSDFKGDFGGSFDSGGNPVLGAFKEGGVLGDPRARMLVGGGLLLALLAGGYFFLNSGVALNGDDFVLAEDGGPAGDLSALEALEEEAAVATAEEPVEDFAFDDEFDRADPPALDEAELMRPPDRDPGATAAPVAVEPAAAGRGRGQVVGVPQLSSPRDGASRPYDEAAAPPEFVWEGEPGGTLEFAAKPQMRPTSLRYRVEGNSHAVRKLPPGTWYWRVRNGAGASAPARITIEPPVRRKLTLMQPLAGAILTGNGDRVAWRGDTNVSYYRVELTKVSFANPAYRFATAGTELQLRDVLPGSYQLRLGAFSEVAGKWEYLQPIDLSIQ